MPDLLTRQKTNADTMVTDNNDTRNIRYMATLIVQVISHCYNTKQYHYCNLKYYSDLIDNTLYVEVPQQNV